jgi:S1-C subfamily serine protease
MNIPARRSPTSVILLAVAVIAALAGALVSRYLAAQTTAAPAPLIAGSPQPLPALVRRVAPAVVNISVLQPSPALQNPLLRDPFFRRYFGVPDSALQPAISAGSGVIVDGRRGMVITNYHVVQNATRIQVGLRDGRTLSAQLLGAAPGVDLAVLRIEARGLPALPLGDSARLQVGEQVVAIGNPFGLGQTVTAGIVSALERGIGQQDARTFVQTDAPINPGNSGGPLINMRGEIVGINSALISPNEGNVGIGFAVPSNVAREVLSQAMRT